MTSKEFVSINFDYMVGYKETGKRCLYEIKGGDTFTASLIQNGKLLWNQEPRVSFHLFEHQPIPGLHRNIIRQVKCRAINIGDENVPKHIGVELRNSTVFQNIIETAGPDDEIIVKYRYHGKNETFKLDRNEIYFEIHDNILGKRAVIYFEDNNAVNYEDDIWMYEDTHFPELTTLEEAIAEEIDGKKQLA